MVETAIPNMHPAPYFAPPLSNIYGEGFMEQTKS